jgi:glucose 1-dehydrogenase
MGMKFSGKVVLVTGAARGIGLATARAFAAEGADVVINDVLDAHAVTEEIRQLGQRALFIRADVADQEQVERMFTQAVDAMGKLNIVVANAAWSERGPLHQVSMDGFHRTIAVTMLGPFYCLRAAVNRMIPQGTGGSIVVISSPHAVVPVPESMAYNMAKAAVDHMARTAAAELFSHRIRVNVIHPGWTNTPGERKYYSEQDIAEQGARIPWKRLAEPAEIARGVLFLANDESEYIDGSTLTIDGGIQLPWAQKI